MSKLKSRWKFLIFPKFQLRLLGMNFILMLVFAVSVFAIIHYSFNLLWEFGVKADLDAGNPFFELVTLQKAVVLKYTALALLFFLVISSFVYLLFTHRMVGPLYRLRRYFENYEPGRPLEFREGDYLEDLAENINSFIQEREH